MLKFSIAVTFERHGALSFMNHISPFHTSHIHMDLQLPCYIVRFGFFGKPTFLSFSAEASYKSTLHFQPSLSPTLCHAYPGGGEDSLQGRALRRRGCQKWWWGGTFFRRKVIFLSQCKWSFWQFRLPFLCFIPQRRQDCCKIFSSHKSHLAVYALYSIILWV